MAIEPTGLLVEPLHGRQFLVVSELRALDGAFQNPDRLVIDSKRHRERVPVLAAVRKGEPRRVGKAVRRPVHDLGHHGERPHRPCPDARREQQLGEVGRTAVGGGGEIPVQAPRHDVARAHLMMAGHYQMRQERLLRGGPRLASLEPRQLACDPVRPEPGEHLELSPARGFRPMVGEVDDLALSRSLDRRVRLFDEALQASESQW